MRDWLKYTFFGFFSHRHATTGKRRNFANVLLSYTMHLTFLTGFLMTGYAMSFSYQTTHNESYQQYIEHVFASDDISYRIDYELKDKTLSSEKLINSFDNESDILYSYRNFSIVLDTRDSMTTYDDFVLTVKDKNNIEYPYVPNMREDSNYFFTFSYSGKALDAVAKQDEYIDYLEEISNPANENYDKGAKSSYDEIKSNETEISAADYNNSIYELFVTYYYPDLDKFGSSSPIPTVSGYYFKNIINGNKGNNAIILLDNMMVIKFVKDNQSFSYEGYFTRVMKTITTNSGTSVVDAKDNINELLTLAFRGGLGVNFTVYFVNAFRFSPFYLFAVLLFGLTAWIIHNIHRNKDTFIGECTVFSSFMLTSSLIASIGGLFLTTFLERGTAFSITFYLCLGLLVVRSLFEILSTINDARKVKQVRLQEIAEEKNR